jgi:putative component of membrane protein insertase Oxa1/YidC/SpoIIIJ protein YidD
MLMFFRNIICYFLLSCFTNTLYGQEIFNDSSYYHTQSNEIIAKLSQNVYLQENTVEYAFKHEPIYKKYNPVYMFFGGLLYIYQKFISEQLSTNCLYEPSCSRFSVQLIRTYGIKGIFLSADRLMRCNSVVASEIPLPIYNFNENNKIIEDVDIYKK